MGGRRRGLVSGVLTVSRGLLYTSRVMLDQLPDTLKSGRQLVATAADGHVGLYTYPDLDDDYRVVNLAGEVTRGDGETVPRPPSGNWRWLSESSAEPEEVEDAPVAAIRRGVAEEDANVSSVHLCALCRVDVRTLDHAHSRAQGGVGAAETVCCGCGCPGGVGCVLNGEAVAA